MADSADAGIPFPADPAGTATIGVTFLADVEMVTVAVTDLTNAEMMFPEEISDFGNMAVTPLVETEMVAMCLDDKVDAAPEKDC